MKVKRGTPEGGKVRIARAATCLDGTLELGGSVLQGENRMPGGYLIVSNTSSSSVVQFKDGIRGSSENQDPDNGDGRITKHRMHGNRHVNMIPAIGIPRIYNVIYYFECMAMRNEGSKRVSKWGAGTMSKGLINGWFLSS